MKTYILGSGRINAVNAVNVAAGAPAMPKYFSKVVNTDHPEIEWTLNTETNITGYEIYRQYDGGSWVHKATVSSSTSNYVDTQVSYTKPVWAKDVSYKVKAVNNLSKKSIFTPSVSFTVIIGGPDRENKPEEEVFAKQNLPIINNISNYPNPFNPTTNIEYSIKENSNVKIVVYNVLGQIVKTLVDENKSAGTYVAKFDAEDLPSGMYYCKIVSNGFNKTIKMLLTK